MAAMDRAELASLAFWRKLNPELHVCDAKFMAHHAASEASRAPVVPRDDVGDIKERMRSDGYATIGAASAWSVNLETLATAALRLRAAGIPPSFIIVYDEVWKLGADAARLMGPVSGGNLPTLDTLCFVVDPRDGCGFSPHRDRVPDDWRVRGDAFRTIASTFRSGGEARYSTLWIALSEASVDNSCLHFIPRFADPGYLDDAEGAEEAELEVEDDGAAEVDAALANNPMHRVFFGKDAHAKGNATFQHIRAAPLQAGAASIHTHRTIHWGSAGRPTSRAAPRVSLSFVFSDPAFEPPYLADATDEDDGAALLPFPRFALRLALASAQIINYSSLAPSDPAGWRAVRGKLRCGSEGDDERGDAAVELSSLRTMHAFFLAEAHRFEEAYRAEIAKKYLAAVLNFGAGALGGAASMNVGGEEEEEEEDGDDDALEDALSAMLDADAAGGGGVFHDDFDVMDREDRESELAEQQHREKETAGEERGRKRARVVDEEDY